MIRSFLLLVCLFSLVSLNAQKGWEAGAWLGTAVYFGDLNNRLDLSNPGLAGGLIGRYNFNTRISAKGTLNYGHVSATDADSPNNFERNRNLSFKSNIIDISSSVEFNFFNYVHGSDDYFYTPYLMVGFSIFRFNPRADLNGETYDLSDYNTELIDYGNVSGGLLPVYPNAGSLQSQTAMDLSDRTLIEGISGEGRQRGNSKDNDSYNFLGVSLMRYFGRLECPRISEPKW